MKKGYCILLLAMLPLLALATSWNETRTVIYPSGMDCQLAPLFPGHSVSRNVNFKLTDSPAKRYLRVIGGVNMPGHFQARGEEFFRQAEFLIDDNLDSLIHKKDHYSLYFKGNDEAFERYAYNRIPGSLLQPGKLTVELPVVKRNHMEIGENGNFDLQLHLYYKKPGRAADDVYDAPDSILYLPVPEGSGKYKTLKQDFNLPENVACVFLQLGGTHFKGECWVEAPRLIQNKKVVKDIPFTKYAGRTEKHNYWVGCNLSTRSWPMWKLTYNGEVVFEGNIFDRASNVADFYIPLPANLPNNGKMELTLLKEDHRAAYNYNLRKLEIIEQPARDYEVISVPRYVAHHTAFGVLVETNRPDVTLKVKAHGGIIPVMQECFFEEPGLHVVEMRAGKAGCALPLVFDDGQRKEKIAVSQVIAKNTDDIYVSSGDEIYIDKEYAPYDYFFKWYISQRVGNWYHFRPSYQWSGFRIARPEIIRHYTGLLNQMKVPYAWQVEGRTLAGSRINPSLTDLYTPMFRGKQAHENDGGYYYWQHFKYQGLFSDMAARTRPYGGIFAKHRPIYTDYGTFVHYDPKKVKDMADGARYLVDNLRYSKGESTRHTGPSTMFRYLYQAGYEWLGAEQMYGPEETILSSLRGASRAYERTKYGTLHAMQWGSFPFDKPEHALRLYMSLAVAYMHGSSHMNTEEALWTDEYMNDRYSKSGKEHLYAQHQVLDFVETHTRRGEMKSNIAVVQGRNDAWKSFVRSNLWSQEGKKWQFNKACESFDLLRVFYPGNIIDACGPNGWFTPTPYGTVDILPIEAKREVMNQYKAMIFLGWNTFDSADFERIRDYVAQGGTLLLSAAHINAELQPDQPTRFPEKDDVVRELLGDNYQQLQDKTIIPLGLGKVIYFPQSAYPAESTLRGAYVEAMKEVAKSTVDGEVKKGWMEASPAVGFTVWDQANRRTLYLLNTNWKEKQHQTAAFVYGQHQFPVQVRQYHIETIHCAEGLAVMPMANTTDVLDIKGTAEGWQVKVQTTGADTLNCMQASNGITEIVRLDKPGIHELVIRRK